MLTLELRWFVPGELGDRELQSFASDGRVEARADRYLLGTGDGIGVKRRGAAELIEHKRRLAQLQVVAMVRDDDQPLLGIAERWRKSWPTHIPVGDWALVEKRRALRRLDGCRAELTLLRGEALASPYLTLAIESADDLPALQKASAALLHARPELAARLAGAESCGYPAWLTARWQLSSRPWLTGPK